MFFTRVVSGLAVGLALVALSTIASGADDAHPPDPGHTVSASDDAPSENARDEHGGGGGGSVSPIPTSWDEIKKLQADLPIWTAGVFLVLMAILWKFAWGPLAQGLEKREQGIADQISQAEQSNRQSKELLQQYEQKLADSTNEVQRIIEKGRQDAEQLGREMLDKARQEARAEQERAVEQIDAATAGALKELARQSSTLAVDLAGKILRAELKPEDHSRLISQAVSDFGKEQPRNGEPSTN